MASSKAVQAMTAGRKAKAAKRLAEDAVDVMLYRAWVKDDADYFYAYRNAVAKAAEATPLGSPGTMTTAEIGDYGGPDQFSIGTVPEPVPEPARRGTPCSQRVLVPYPVLYRSHRCHR